MSDARSDLVSAADMLLSFTGVQLTSRIASLERDFNRAAGKKIPTLLAEAEVSAELLRSAYLLKRTAGQINVAIHAIGILRCLPHILRPTEVVQYLSLGAGNTGREFDLETDHRIAEFKFTHWKGGTETIRQNALFKDLYFLAESRSLKQKYVYVLGTKYPLKFLNGRRALRSVMSRNRALWEDFQSRYGASLATVADYYSLRGGDVRLEDVSAFVPELETSV